MRSRPLCVVALVGSVALAACAPPREPASPKTFNAQFCVERSLRRTADPRTLPLAFSEFTKACEQGEGSACSSLGVMHELGLGTSEDHAQAYKLYQTACASQNIGGCTNLGLALLHGVGVAVDPRRARELLVWSCNHDHPIGCRELGVMHLLGEGGAVDISAAATYFRAGCKKGDGEACYNIAALYEQGNSLAQDNAQALSFFEQSCVLGEARGCDGADRIHTLSAQAQRERAAVKAVPSETACEAGQASECTAAGLAYFRGDSVKRDVPHAVLLLKRACTLGDATSCSILEPMLQGSCAHGHDESCSALKALAAEGPTTTITRTGEDVAGGVPGAR